MNDLQPSSTFSAFTTLRSAYGTSRPSVICPYCCYYPDRDLNFSEIFLQCLIAQGLRQSVLKFWAKI